MLVLKTHRLLSLFPGVAPRGQQVVVQPAALLKLLFEEALLLFIRVQAVLECLTHEYCIRIKRTYCQAQVLVACGRRGFHPHGGSQGPSAAKKGKAWHARVGQGRPAK